MTRRMFLRILQIIFLWKRSVVNLSWFSCGSSNWRNWRMLVFVDGGKPENSEKNPRSKVNTHMAQGRNRTRATSAGDRALSPQRPAPFLPYITRKHCISVVCSLSYRRILAGNEHRLVTFNQWEIAKCEPVLQHSYRQMCDSFRASWFIIVLGSRGKLRLIDLVSSSYLPYSYGGEGINLDIRAILFLLSWYVTLNI